MKTTGRMARACGGYTLLEIALVVTIITLLIGAVVPLTSGYTREQRLRDVARELLVLAKTARTEAMTTGRAVQLVFDKGSFGLLRPGDEEPSDAVDLPAGIGLSVTPYGAEKGDRANGQRWVFQPTGICEPIAVRIAEDDAWLEISFDPLTASIADESYHIP